MPFINRTIAICAAVLSLAGCVDNGDLTVAPTEYPKLSDVPLEKLERLSQHTYFFGHQSVGVNIVDGLAVVLKDNPSIKLHVTKSEDTSQLTPGTFMHSRIGKNREPATKISAFERL